MPTTYAHKIAGLERRVRNLEAKLAAAQAQLARPPRRMRAKLSVRCDECGADAGAWCRTPANERTERLHHVRAREQPCPAACPTCRSFFALSVVAGD
jgi:hypothetical protein